MYNSVFLFHLVIALTNISIVLINIATFTIFRNFQSFDGRLLLAIAVNGLLFLAVSFVTGRFFVKRFSVNYSELQNKPGEYETALKKLSSVPIKIFLLMIPLTALYVLLVFLGGNLFSIYKWIGLAFFGFIFTCSMVITTNMYAFLQQLVMKTLLKSKLTQYPASLRTNGQVNSSALTTIFIMVDTLVFAFSYVFLLIDIVGGNISNMDMTTWRNCFALVTVFTGLAIIAVFSLRKMNKMNYDAVLSQFDGLTESEKDLTKRIHISSVDELGNISGMMNTFCENLQAGLSELKEGQVLLKESGVKLDDSSKNTVGSLDDMSVRVNKIGQMSQQQLQNVADSSEAISVVSNNINELDTLIGLQSESISTASASIEEMVENINSIDKSIDVMYNEFEALNKAAESGKTKQSESSQSVAEIVERSKALQQANKIISTIAAQTNLLAMNAAIEAAHAGEAGSGFSVVADEIRNLAENSSRESQKINSELKLVEQIIQKIVSASSLSVESFSLVAEKIDSTKNLVLEVTKAIDEQQTGARQTMESLKDMNDITGRVKTSAAGMNAGSTTILKEIEQLTAASNEVHSSVDGIVSRIGDIHNTAHGVSELAAENQKTIDKMDRAINEFTIE
ncbi:methyl-accepting chemotaxis protein [Brucepastera parasyntrophica]|uniref:methyl-accepting chemotaxis protein n=1 Tax=Brucepastera parasyntrophica TaxID=2880008 RepID=UPI00210B6B51|nr:methyl-accepting chemotaxis protein [Brucepastera parasyntrophica]ULQ58552.1 methyl-accepting chemotaxis protein [Brucepastera parasyntrophica]